MKSLRLIHVSTIAIAIFILCLLWQLPASVLEPLVLRASEGRLMLAASEGRVWQGRSSLFVRAAPAEAWQAAGEIAWDTRIQGAPDGQGMSGLPVPTLHLQQYGGAMQLVPTWHGLHVHVARWHLPLTAILACQQGLPVKGWGGTLVLEQSRIVQPWQGGQWQGEGVLYWREARTSLLESHWLGHYRLDWQQQEKGLSGQISTLEGVLQCQGQLVRPVGGRLQFTGTAKADGPHRALLEAPLRLLGEASGHDAYRIRWPAP